MRWTDCLKYGGLKYLKAFPLEDSLKREVEKNCAESVNKAWKIMGTVIVIFQVLMLLFMAMRPGGVFKSQRRMIYCALYALLLAVTVFAMIYNRSFWKRETKNYHTYLNGVIFYSAFICFWGCCVTLNDQLGGNDLSVFTYMMLSAAAIGLMEPAKACRIFFSAFLFLNICLPGVQIIENNVFSNVVNSFSIAAISSAISFNLYRNKVNVTRQEMTIRRQYEEIAKANEVLSRQVMMDELTEMNNRRYIEGFVRSRMDRLGSGEKVVSCMMIDIDFFKKYNDRYGHISGDTCLKKIAEVIRECCKDENAAAIRYGGEEFFICLFSVGQKEAVRRAEDMRGKIAECRFPIEGGEMGAVTVSIGVYTWRGDGEIQVDELIRVSDEALYRAKKNGRNRVEIWNGESA